MAREHGTAKGKCWEGVGRACAVIRTMHLIMRFIIIMFFLGPRHAVGSRMRAFIVLGGEGWGVYLEFSTRFSPRPPPRSTYALSQYEGVICEIIDPSGGVVIRWGQQRPDP